MPLSFNGLGPADTLRGVQTKDANGFDLTACPHIGISEMAILHRAGLNSVLSLVNANPTLLMNALGCTLQTANEIMAWAEEAAYPAVSTADSEMVEAYEDAGLGVPVDADPEGAAETAAESARMLREPKVIPGGLDGEGNPVEEEEEAPLPIDTRQSTGFSRVRVVDGEVKEGSSGRKSKGEETDQDRLEARRRKRRSSAVAVDPQIR